MEKFLVIILGIFSFLKLTFAHEYWIDSQNYFPKQKEKVKIFVACGHYFPKSQDVISEKVLDDTKIITPRKKVIYYETIPEKRYRVGETVFQERGVHILTFSLKKPIQEERFYFAKSLILVEGIVEDINFSSGEILEIIPQKNIFSIKEGEELPLNVLFNKKPTICTLNISIAEKKTFLIRTNKNGVAKIKVKKGKYLITTNVKMKGASLTFCIK